MKRRNFLKGLAAIVIAPTAAIAKTSTSPAKVEPYCTLPVGEKVEVPLYNIPHWDKEHRKEFLANTRILRDHLHAAIQKHSAATDKARRAAEKLRKSLEDLHISPEAIDDIRQWGVDQIDETTRREIFLGEAPDYRAVALKGPVMIHGWGFNESKDGDYTAKSPCPISIELPVAADCEWDDKEHKWVKKEEVNA